MGRVASPPFLCWCAPGDAVSTRGCPSSSESIGIRIFAEVTGWCEVGSCNLPFHPESAPNFRIICKVFDDPAFEVMGLGKKNRVVGR